MPDFTLIAVTTAKGAPEAELDGLVADFDDESEARGYARRMAEESHGLAAQLDLDFDYSHVSVFTGDVDVQTADTDNPALVGMWLFAEDGVDWATADDLRAAPDEAADADAVHDAGAT